MHPGGNIVLAGYAHDGTAEDFALARYVSGLSVSVHDVAATDITASVFPNPVVLKYTLNTPATVLIRLFDGL